MNRVGGGRGAFPLPATTCILSVAAALPLLLFLVTAPAGAVTIIAPAALRGSSFAAQPADFGHDYFASAVEGAVVRPIGMHAFLCAQQKDSPRNNLRGKIVLVGRGKCTFHTKALNAKRAGAVGLIVANNVSLGTVGDVRALSGRVRQCEPSARR